MNEDLEIQEVFFKEMTFVDESEFAKSFLDVLLKEQATNRTYCKVLIEKVLEINISDVLNFIYHHVQQVMHKLVWLDQFEKLVAVNEKIFTKSRNIPKMMKIFSSIAEKRSKLKLLDNIKNPNKPKANFINAESDERYFSFNQTVEKLKQMEDYCEQILFLTQEKHEYEQADLEFINQKLENFATQCQKKIDHLQHMRKLKNELMQSELKAAHQKADFNKLQFNGNINQLVDVFYQMYRELFVPNIHRNYIDGHLNDLVKIIHYSFTDKEGKDLSMETIKTLLSPSKDDKRPSINKRIDVESILDKKEFPT